MKRSKLYSILNNKCAACHEGDYFVNKVSFNPKKFSEANETCPHCNHKFEKEPGFFIGAMYVSYAISVALGVATFLFILALFPAATYITYITAIILVQFIFVPLSFRISRLAWINMFSGYKEPK